MSILPFLLFAAALSSVESRRVNFYRKDYSYVAEYDAFYKFHWDHNGSTWSSTFLACDDEGAELFYPKARDEWTVVKKLVEASPSAQNVSEIFVGIYDKFRIGEFVTFNAPILNVETSGERRCATLDIDSGVLEANECFAEPGTTRPFVCKKVEDVSCPTIDKGYHYMKETRKCYKLNKKQMNWSKSMETCMMEGGILVVVESDLEAEIIRTKILNTHGSNVFYAGFKKIFSDQDYFTVKGHKLSDTGYERWSNDRNYECGIILDGNNNYILDSAECDSKLPFVCEMNVLV